MKADCKHEAQDNGHCKEPGELCKNSHFNCWAHGLYAKAHPEVKCTRKK